MSATSPNHSQDPANLISANQQIVHVRNLREARREAHRYSGVLTMGPEPWEVDDFGHRNHRIFTFEDVPYHWYPDAPTYNQIESAVTWGAEQTGPLLVHCHYGISRSTATAWGILLARGEDPEEAFLRLRTEHPVEVDGSTREFAPNVLVVSYLEKILEIPGLLELRHRLW